MTAGEIEAQKEHLNAWLCRVLTPWGAVRWWDTANPKLAGTTPQQALEEGHYREVQKVVWGYLDPSFS